MKRPSVTSEMILAAAEEIAERVGGDAATIAEHYSHPMDGYELAKQLDKWAYWDVSREDMETLDEMEMLVRDAHSKAEKEWVEQYSIEPPFPVGTFVETRRGVGQIDGISSHSPACYEVKPKGQNDDEASRLRWIVKFEEVEAAA